MTGSCTRLIPAMHRGANRTDRNRKPQRLSKTPFVVPIRAKDNPVSIVQLDQVFKREWVLSDQRALAEQVELVRESKQRNQGLCDTTELVVSEST